MRDGFHDPSFPKSSIFEKLPAELLKNEKLRLVHANTDVT